MLAIFSCIQHDFGSIFMFWLHIFMIFSENVLPAWPGSTILKIDINHFNEKSFFLDVETAQIEPVMVMCFGPIALSFAPFPFYPLHAPQAGPRKTSQICVLFLHVPSLGDLNYVSYIKLMPS